jgi:hypothetical protein
MASKYCAICAAPEALWSTGPYGVAALDKAPAAGWGGSNGGIDKLTVN